MSKNIRPALKPDDLENFFIQRLNAGDIEGLLALYEQDAVMVTGENQTISGIEAIRKFFTDLLADKPQFKPGKQRPAIQAAGDIALTSALLPDGSVTAEVARRQPDGTWRWIIDQPAIARETVKE
ncbi:MAG: ketosteroid isomerase family protein [Ignavibacteriaceae bacterium]